MYQKLAENVAISDTNSMQSPAIAMEGANAVQVDFVLISKDSGVTQVTVQVQESNDLENWTDLVSGGSGTLSDIGYSTFSAPTIASGQRIASSFVRLVYSVSTGTGDAIISVGVNTSAA